MSDEYVVLSQKSKVPASNYSYKTEINYTEISIYDNNNIIFDIFAILNTYFWYLSKII